jgi:hypothetical protein
VYRARKAGLVYASRRFVYVNNTLGFALGHETVLDEVRITTGVQLQGPRERSDRGPCQLQRPSWTASVLIHGNSLSELGGRAGPSRYAAMRGTTSFNA